MSSPEGEPAGAVRVSAWAPLRIPTFRSLWGAQLGSNVGTWMQTVGAQWALIHTANAATLVSWVQAASLLPVMFLSLPAGVLADVVDKRRLLLATSLGMAAIAALLAGLTSAGLATPTVLLLLTFALGAGTAMTNPAWQAIQPDLVPRTQIPQAAALASLSVNVARAVGPALAGVLVAVSGPALVFGINAASFLLVAFAVWRWRRPPDANDDPERAVAALRAGERYVRAAPGVRRILLRSGLFVLPASALWALLPIVANRSLGLGSGGYGLLLAALGIGSIIGALTIGWFRARASNNLLVVGGSVVFGLGTLVLALVHSVPVVLVAMLPTGIAWLLVLSTLNTSMQLTLPAWVRARGLATYLVVFMGGQGIGSLVWGVSGSRWGVPETLVLAGALLLASAATVAWWPLRAQTGRLDRTAATPWPEPTLAFEPPASDGPVLVTVAYHVEADEVPDFLGAVRTQGLSRRRTGAYRWAVFRDASAEDVYVEVFEVRSWGEHLRQHTQRMTGYDAEVDARVKGYAEGELDVRHLVPVDPR